MIFYEVLLSSEKSHYLLIGPHSESNLVSQAAAVEGLTELKKLPEGFAW